MEEDRYDYVIVGAGVMGLSTAWSLASRDAGRIALLDAHTVGHKRGSSQGAVRIARSTYADPGYVHLMSRARRDAWPRLEKRLGRRLITPSEACFFGPASGLIQDYLTGVRSLGDRVHVVSQADVPVLFPQLRDSTQIVIRDTTAGCIDAAAARIGLHRLLNEDENVCCVENMKVFDIEFSESALRLNCAEKTILGEKVVLTAGPWTSRLIPELDSRLMVHRQDIGYFHDASIPPRSSLDFPWVYLGLNQEQVYYGLPEDTGHLKAARHRRSGLESNPDDRPESDQQALEKLVHFISSEFQNDLALRWSDTCPYTSTATDDFILSCHPDDDRVVIGAGFSGHGFKFAPLVGHILADLAMHAECALPEFLSMKEQFAF